jgi:AcrR family transcriptional regulator
MTKSTAQAIVEAALEALRTEGFAGATSRAIARIGGFNQALIFYHHGSLEQLLLAALARTGEERLARYREALAPVTRLDEAAAARRPNLRWRPEGQPVAAD